MKVLGHEIPDWLADHDQRRDVWVVEKSDRHPTGFTVLARIISNLTFTDEPFVVFCWKTEKPMTLGDGLTTRLFPTEAEAWEAIVRELGHRSEVAIAEAGRAAVETPTPPSEPSPASAPSA